MKISLLVLDTDTGVTSDFKLAVKNAISLRKAMIERRIIIMGIKCPLKCQLRTDNEADRRLIVDSGLIEPNTPAGFLWASRMVKYKMFVCEDKKAYKSCKKYIQHSL